MATFGRRNGLMVAAQPDPPILGALAASLIARLPSLSPQYGWRSKTSPMELINEIPPIKVQGRIVACEGENNPALGHPIEFICLDKDEPTVCKYCGLRYLQDHHH